MRKLAFNSLALIFAAFVHTTIHSATFPERDFEKVIRKEFSISSDGVVDIDNMYGKININPTTGSEVVIEVTLKVDKKNEKDAEEFFEHVNIDFSDTRNRISAKTEMESKQKTSWSKWLNPSNWNNNNNYSINYEVWMPASCRLELENKYGDVSIGDMESDVMVELKYGDGIFENVAGDLVLELAYGDVRMGDARNMDLDIRYGELKGGSADEIKCDSKYSEIYLKNANSFISDSGYDDFVLGDIGTFINDGGYDDFEIRSVEVFEIDSHYSDYEFDQLSGGGEFESGYGSLEVDEVTNLTRDIYIKGRYTDVSLGLDLPFKIDLDGRYTDVDMPSQMDYSQRIKEDNDVRYVGTFKGGTHKITCKMSYGSFEVN